MLDMQTNVFDMGEFGKHDGVGVKISGGPQCCPSTFWVMVQEGGSASMCGVEIQAYMCFCSPCSVTLTNMSWVECCWEAIQREYFYKCPTSQMSPI